MIYISYWRWPQLSIATSTFEAVRNPQLFVHLLKGKRGLGALGKLHLQLLPAVLHKTLSALTCTSLTLSPPRVHALGGVELLF